MKKIIHAGVYAASLALLLSSCSGNKEPTKQVTKKYGTVDSRENDLDELCQDWVFYKAKAYKYGREGNQEEAAEARKNFAAVNSDLSEYRDNDVTETCAKYDTEENLAKYMR